MFTEQDKGYEEFAFKFDISKFYKEYMSKTEVS